jgi:hypothetical protein
MKNELEVLKNRLSKIGIEIELIGNIPWIYLRSVNGNFVKKEDWTANHGYTIAFYGAKTDGIVLDSDTSRIFKVIRKYYKPEKQAQGKKNERKVEYKNRYGDLYTFTWQSINLIKWEGPFKHYRFSMSDDERVTMVDPSGGPYIGIGAEMDRISPEFKGLTVSAMNMEDDVVWLTCDVNFKTI